ncbi:MAG TPA: hypothetical protein VHO03_01340 [Ignavibacteriales bacterium]|nr:hypothetical protein [Ignavibacteriales bacterium]
MNKIKDLMIIRILALTALLFAFNIAAYAQDNAQNQSGSAQDGMYSFGNDAQNLANQLAQQLGLTTGQADKITQALIDYRDNLVQARKDYLDKHQTAMNNNTNNNTENNPGARDVTGSSIRPMAGDIDSAPDLMQDYQKADQKADKDILDAMDNHQQKEKYVQVKRQWWDKVKNVVYPTIKQQPSAADQNSGDQQTK